jgi:hypothetical protein
MTKRISDVDPIIATANESINGRDEIRGVVEEPLVVVCEYLFDRNIRTTETSANRRDAGSNGLIAIDYSMLSEENKRVADSAISRGQAYKKEIGRLSDVRFPFPINTGDLTVDEISTVALSLVKDFGYQELPFGWGKYHKKDFLEGVLLGVTPFEEARSLYPYDGRRDIFYINEEFRLKDQN